MRYFWSEVWFEFASAAWLTAFVFVMLHLAPISVGLAWAIGSIIVLILVLYL